ncbi:ABC transporter substrate-binding protein [Psychromonas sp. PT13]|uniref:ABC transporter substrate-binding protein n=1 Tax=Psychromonas sp. PT13 TaxID=3439547 RepID=UPI003EBA7B5E
MRFLHVITILLTYLLCSFSLADEIKIFTWEDNFSPKVISDFEKQSGHTIKQIYFDSEMLRDQVVYTNKANVYDLFVVDNLTLEVLIAKGIVSELANSLLGDSSNFRADANTACGKYGIPQAFGSMGIGYRSSKVSKPLTSWMDVFEYAKQVPGSVIIPNENIDTTAIALMALGYKPMSTNESELKEAYQLLNSVITNLLAFRNGFGYAMDKGKESKAEVMVFYSGEKENIEKVTEQDDWVYTIPNEGTLLWHECLSSHRDKPMNQATIDFVKFINTPNNAIKNAQEFWFATPNKAALKLASDDYRNDQELFPTNLSVDRSFHYERLDKATLNTRSKIISVLSK